MRNPSTSLSSAAFGWTAVRLKNVPASSLKGEKHDAALLRSAHGRGFILQLEPAFAGAKQITEDFETSPTPGGLAKAPARASISEKARPIRAKAMRGSDARRESVRSALGSISRNTVSVQYKHGSNYRPHLPTDTMQVSGGDGKNIGPIIKDLTLPQVLQVYPNPTEYSLYHFDFNSGPDQKILFSIALNSKDANIWADIDDFEISCK